MKCVKNGVNIKRVKDDVVERYIKAGYAYCSKSEWKNAGKVQEEVIEVVKKVKKIKGDKKRMKRDNPEVASRS